MFRLQLLKPPCLGKTSLLSNILGFHPISNLWPAKDMETVSLKSEGLFHSHVVGFFVIDRSMELPAK